MNVVLLFNGTDISLIFSVTFALYSVNSNYWFWVLLKLTFELKNISPDKKRQNVILASEPAKSNVFLFKRKEGFI